MTLPTGRKRQGPALLLILVIAMLLDKFWISRVLPEASGLIGINPMLVFLDIPVDLSLSFGLLSVTVLFILLYMILILPYHSGNDTIAWQGAVPHLWRSVTGMLAIPFCVLSGGMIYAASRDYLPKHARNAIESFGINADIYTSFPGHELIHLKGSMVMLGCLFIGITIFRRRIKVSARDTELLLSPQETKITHAEHPEFIAEGG